MSRRATIWIVFIGVLIVALAVFFAVRGGFGPGAPPVRQEPAEPPPAAVIDEGGADWPMFGGNQGLLGRAPGALSDSLTLLWRFKTGAEVKSCPVICEGRVFVGSSDASVYAIDLRSGAKLWSYATGDVVEAAPCVTGGSVFVGSSDGVLYALEAETGALRWKYETEAEILGAANWALSADGQKTRVLVGSYDNRVHCVDADSGQAVWVYETDNYVNGSPAADNGKCVFGGCDAFIHVVSLADGSEAAQIDTGSYIAASAAFLDGQVYVGNYDGVFIRVDVEPNEIVWEYDRGEAPFFSSPAVGADVVVFGGRDERVHCVRRDDGSQVWTFKTLGEVNSSPAICGDKIVVGSDDGRLYMLRLGDGKRLWSYEMGQPITSSPAVAHGLVVVGCDDGYVYAFGPKPGDRSDAR
ncbi:MAG: PQQ-binding-like beta-propeller repeat protein [Sedimentisphaerales bacterium]|nr:PQQ-binding-like beta-propeller repeat protein [Sedimentisphaerales bacterium]